MEQVAVGTGSLVLAVLIVVKTVSALVITGAIGGLNTTDGSRPYRYDIDLFYNSGPAWDLYILSLSSIQNLSQSELTSFFSVAGMQSAPTPYVVSNSNKEFMAFQEYRGMVSLGLVAILAFARMLRRRFLYGTVHT